MPAGVGAVVSAAAGRTVWPWALIAGLGAAGFLGRLGAYRAGGFAVFRPRGVVDSQ